MVEEQRMRRQFIFLIPGYTGIGELLIAIYMARQIKNSDLNAQVVFFAANCYKPILDEYCISHTVLLKGCGKVNRILLLDRLYKNRNTIMIISDIINFYTSISDWGLSVNDFFEFKGSLYGLDLYEYENRFSDMDTYGFISQNFRELSKVWKIFDKVITPCPVGNINEKTGTKYPLIGKEDIVNRSKESIIEIKERYGIPANRKVVLVLSALWQVAGTKYPEAEKQIYLFNEAYEKIINYLCERAVVLCVGGSRKIQESERSFSVGLNSIGSVTPSEMEYYFKMADLLITRNDISTTVAKAALSNVPVISLVCSDKEIKYRYRMYPVGWYEFLEHIVRDNPYYEIVKEYNVFDYEKIIGAIDQVLCGKTQEKNTKLVSKYLESIWEIDIMSIFEENK